VQPKEVAGQENSILTPGQKVVERLRPWIGALIGILVFALFLLLTQATESRLLWAALLWPGILTTLLSALLGFSSSIMIIMITFFIPSVPFGIIGYLLGSYQKKAKENGLVLLVIYVATSILMAIFVLGLAAINN
jgi:surface polysaccharide O-acyltransferase-like enzyme